VTLTAVLLLFNLFAVLHLAPENMALQENDEHERGDFDFRVDRVFKFANERAALNILDVRNRFLQNDHNPALFNAVAEMFVRAGAETPLPNQLFTLVLFNLGLAFFYLWTRAASNSDLFAGAATVFLLSTPYLLYHSVSIHECSYQLLFFNLTLWAFCRYLGTSRLGWLALSCVAYFFVCLSYWMFYVSTFLLLIALQLKFRKLRLSTMAIVAVPPIAGFVFILWQITLTEGDLATAIEQLQRIGGSRTFDVDFAGTEIHAREQVVNEAAISGYPRVLMDRIAVMMGLPVPVFGAAFLATLLLAGRRAWSRHGWMLLVILAGVSWNLVMIQHTIIHKFAAMYGYYAWALIVAAFVEELSGALGREDSPRVLAMLCAPAVILVFYGTYVTELIGYVRNILG